MAHEYRYPLTRVCLRGGNMTLPRVMIGLFPDSGEVTFIDSTTGEEHVVHMSGPRVVSGLGPLYRAHELDVNDELLIEPLDGNRFSFTPVLRSQAEAEAPDVEEDVGAPGEAVPSGASMGEEPPEPATTGYTGEAAEPGTPVEATAGSAHGTVPEGQDDATDAPPPPNLDPRQAVLEAESALTELELDQGAHLMGRTDTRQASLWESNVVASEEEEPDASPVATGEADPAPPESSMAGPEDPEVAPPAPRATVRPARPPAYVEDEDASATVEAVALSSRLRRVFTKLGYRIEPLATGVHYLHADLGRRRYKVLVQLLRSGERLDWAGLLSRRRNAPANYLAVVGDRADLLRLANPADLARATLWSWEALSRLEELHGSVPVTPLDLESHFGRDGLFEQGLKRFEEGVASRVAERGATSEVITRLARNRAPSVFLLEELAQDVNLSRDVVLRILDRLSEAPLHLVARVDSGEFLLRQPVGAALSSLSAYAESLRQRLPVGRREVITGLDDGEYASDLLDGPPEQEQSPFDDAVEANSASGAADH